MRNDGKTTLLVACFSFVHEHARMRVCGASVCVLGMFSFTWGDVILNLAKSYSPVGSPPYSIQSHSRLNWTTVPDAQRETETEKDRTKEAIKEIETFAVLFFSLWKLPWWERQENQNKNNQIEWILKVSWEQRIAFISWNCLWGRVAEFAAYGQWAAADPTYGDESCGSYMSAWSKWWRFGSTVDNAKTVRLRFEHWNRKIRTKFAPRQLNRIVGSGLNNEFGLCVSIQFGVRSNTTSKPGHVRTD